MGNPKGFAFAFRTVDDSNPTAAAEAEAALQNSLLVIAPIAASPFSDSFRNATGLKLPSSSAFGADVFLRQIRIVDPKIDGIPGKLLAGEHGDVAEQQGLCDQILEFEIPARPDFAALACIQPLTLVTGRSRERLRRLLVCIHFALRDEPGIFSIKCAENLATISDKEQPFVLILFPAKWTIRLQLGWTRRLQTTVVPSEAQRRHIAPGVEIVMDDLGLGVGFIVAIGGTRLDAHRHFQLHDPKDRVVAVAAHVAKRAATEIDPSAPGKGQVRMMEGALRRRAEPEVPIEALGHGL